MNKLDFIAVYYIAILVFVFFTFTTRVLSYFR